MALLDTYTTPLSSSLAAHLLRRATFGPTRQEISSLTGKTASQAFNILLANCSYRASPPPPVEMDTARADAGQPFLTKPFSNERNGTYFYYIQYWWIGLMIEQNGYPSLLEKLTSFWQNHFVTAKAAINEYRYTDKYLRLLRSNALGNFRDLVTEITKDPAMLIFQNGNENTKEKPNENYARELQELFTVGQKDFAGNHNYTEEDVKAAAKVLTGWQATNFRLEGSTSFGSVFNSSRHDTSSKTFSPKYQNAIIAGRTGDAAGDAELGDLVTMLLRHPETPKFICRKLYRWYVNTNVTQEIEDQVIAPLANFFASSTNNYAIAPVLEKLLTSQIFFDARNVGAIVKSPAEFMIGALRLFDQPVPDISTEFGPFRALVNYIGTSMAMLQLNLLDQPSVFGSLPYYQTGYSRNWINGTALGIRNDRISRLIYPTMTIKPGYVLGVDILGRLKIRQPNFSDVSGTAAITCEEVLQDLSTNLFATELSQIQRDFLIDKIMMMNSSPRTTWVKEWNSYRAAPNDLTKQNVILWRCRTLMKHMVGMAEFQLF